MGLRSLRIGGGWPVQKAAFLWTGWWKTGRCCERTAKKSEDSGDGARNPAPVLRPDAFVRRLSAVSLDDLAARGFAGIIIDLDNTLVGYGQNDLAAEDVAWIASARAAGFRICLVSNNFSERVARVGAQAGVPAIARALKPLPRGFVAARRLLGTSKTTTLVIGDQLFTDVLGAKLAGLHCILTEPLVGRDWLGTRVLRLLERVVLGRRPAA